jgi:hypothetical protein
VAAQWRKTIRLTIVMLGSALVGGFLGLMFNAVGNGFDPWFVTAPIRWAIGGSLVGLCAELYARVSDLSARREFFLAGVVVALLAILWFALIV